MLNTLKIRSLMALKGLDQAALAAKLHISQSSLSRKIRGISDFTCDEVEEMCAALGVDDPKLACEIFYPNCSNNATKFDKEAHPMIALMIFILSGLLVLAYLESPKRDHEASQRACVKACIHRKPKAYRRGYMAMKPPYTYYY